MIKNFLAVEPPKVKLRNLGVHNVCSFYVSKDALDYPIACFAKSHKDGGVSIMGIWDDPKECPKGYKVYEQFDNPTEALLDYAEMLRLEHIDLTDELINHNPSFRGRKRSARWQDERRRRGLIQ